MGEEDCRKSECVNHGYQAATLFHPVGTCSPERTSVVTDTAGKGCADHVTHATHPQKGVHPRGVDECRHDQLAMHASAFQC